MTSKQPLFRCAVREQYADSIEAGIVDAADVPPPLDAAA
jgi:hypothetical protein